MAARLLVLVLLGASVLAAAPSAEAHWVKCGYFGPTVPTHIDPADPSAVLGIGPCENIHCRSIDPVLGCTETHP